MDGTACGIKLTDVKVVVDVDEVEVVDLMQL